MKNILRLIAVTALFAIASCADLGLLNGIESTVIERAELDSATMLVVDSTQTFDNLPNANQMLVYQDSILVVSNRNPGYGKPIISLYNLNAKMRHFADYIPQGTGIDEMLACRLTIIGDNLFVYDSYYTGSYCDISLKRPLQTANTLHLSYSGIQEHGSAVAPFNNGLLVENPQCYNNDDAGIHNNVPRLLYYENGRCRTQQPKTTFQVADINTGADILTNSSNHRVCFVSYRQPIVEIYDDSLNLIRNLMFPSSYKQKIYKMTPQSTMHQSHNRSEKGNGMSATFQKTQRVVGAGSQLHAFLCSAADEEYIYLVYCGKKFDYAFHTFPTYIAVLDWNGYLIETYRFNRWIQSISPSSQAGKFYLTVYAEDDYRSTRTKLISTRISEKPCPMQTRSI